MANRKCIRRVGRSVGWIASFALGIGAGDPTGAWAMGSKPASSQPVTQAPAGGSCSISDAERIPYPVRPVLLRAVATKPFPLPNGSTVDLSRELAEFFLTSVAQTSTLQPEENDGSTAALASDCDSHLEIRAAVTTLELNMLQFGITVGYSPEGAHGGITNLNGKADIKVGTIGMDFSLWECSKGKCRAVTAANANQTTLTQASLSMQIDFGAVHTGPELIYNTPLGKVLRQIMLNGVSQIAASPRLNELPWSATVREWIAESGAVIFDAGTRERLKAGQLFTVYASAGTQGACGVYKPVAYVRSIQADVVSSIAVVEQVLDARGVRAGDVVMIRSSGVSAQ